MKLSLVISTQEIRDPIPVALLSGSFEERLRKAALLGYEGVELMVARPGELDADTIWSSLCKMELEVAAIGSGAVNMMDRLTLIAADPDISRLAEDRLHALIQFAAALHAPLVTIGGFRGRATIAGGLTAREQLIAILYRAGDKAAQEGVRLVIEPLNRYETDIVNNTIEGLGLIAEVHHSHLGLMLDTFHVNIEEASITECFRQAMSAAKLWHVHLGDSNRLPPGQGHIDFQSIVNTLREIEYNGFLSAELLPRPDADLAAEATIRAMRQYISIS